jgi:predicted nucleic acid-binding protein
MKTLIDTTAWYDYFSSDSSPLGDRVFALIRSGEGCTTGIIIAEVLDAIEDRARVPYVAGAMLSLPCLEDSLEVWQHTAQLSFRTRQLGFHPPLAVLHIASHSIYHHVPIFAAQNRFRQIPGVKLRE